LSTTCLQSDSRRGATRSARLVIVVTIWSDLLPYGRNRGIMYP
jgi:hypothetical protein